MATHILNALINIKRSRENNLSKYKNFSRNSPRVNLVGEPLDNFMKDALCNSFRLSAPQKIERYNEELSHYGDQNNPPDIIIRGSDAIEVKKVGIRNNEMQLNSSYPKSKLKSNDPFITNACKNCEPEWQEKDLIYAIGHIQQDKIKVLTLVYGDCYVADTEHYKRIRQKLIDNIRRLDFPFANTKEFARINEIDSLNITKLRVRGMWIMKLPLRIFPDIMRPDPNLVSVFTLMKKEKYESFGEEITGLIERDFNVENVQIKDPNNPDRLMDAKLISFHYQSVP